MSTSVQVFPGCEVVGFIDNKRVEEKSDYRYWVKVMERGLLAIRLVKHTLGNGSGSLELFGEEEAKDLKKAWQLGKKILEPSEVDSFRNMLKNYAD